MSGPLVVAIARGSSEDGPGMRSVVFFKGCPLSCSFCHNPETQSPAPEVAFAPERCIGCGACAAACPTAAIDLSRAERIDRARCDGCGRCAAVCPTSALRRIGERVEPAVLVERLLADRALWRHSGGGVTLSGGEPAMWPDTLAALLPPLRRAGAHIAMETAGAFAWPAFAERVLPHLDLVLFDVKLADPEAHRRVTGAGNARILENLARLCADGRVAVRPRVPIVPGVTDGDDNLRAIAKLLLEAGARTVELLPWNPLGLATYPRLGRPRPPLPERFCTIEEERRLRARFAGLLATVGKTVRTEF